MKIPLNSAFWIALILFLIIPHKVIGQPEISKELIPNDAPPEVVSKINDLYSENPRTRATAATKLGEMGDSAEIAIPWLLEMFRDDSVTIAYPNPFGGVPDWTDCPAKQAALALSRIGGPAIDSLLVKYDAGDASDRLWTVYALCQTTETRTTPILMDYLRTSKSPWNMKFKFVNGVYWSELPSQKEPLKSGWIEKDILNALGERRDTSAVELLLELASDTSFVMQDGAIDALAKIGDLQAVEPLLKMLDVPDRLPHASHALAYINDRRAVNPLLSHLKDKNGEFNTYVMLALGEFESEEAVQAIIPALCNPNHHIRRIAAQALGADGGGWVWWVGNTLEDKRPKAKDRISAVEPLIAALSDTVPEVRQQVISALGAIGDFRAFQPLWEIWTHDKDATASYWALDALIDITGEECRGDKEKWRVWKEKWVYREEWKRR